MELKYVAAVAIALVSSSVRSEPPEKKAYHYAPALEEALGFSRAVRAGQTLYISGSVGRGAMPEALRESYDRIAATLQAHGLDFSDVVKETVFTTDLAAFRENNDIRKSYYKGEYPASSWVQVAALNTPELVVEVEAVAVFPARP